MCQEQLHSQEYLGDHRDLWWNKDFLELMVRRLGLHQCFSILDVGHGQGHWGNLLMTFLPDQAVLTGVDREKEWIKMAKQKNPKTNCVVADAYQLPFADESFDLVTCQTLMIHLEKPLEALREMKRILKKGGTLLLAEPCNMANSIVQSNVNEFLSIQEECELICFNFHCERGKKNLKLGDNSVGDLLPGYLAQLDFFHINVAISDKAQMYIPNSENVEQKINTKMTLDDSEREFLIWDKEETKRYFLAGEGSEKDFEKLFSLALKKQKMIAHALREKTFYTSGGGIHYLISAIK